MFLFSDQNTGFDTIVFELILLIQIHIKSNILINLNSFWSLTFLTLLETGILIETCSHCQAINLN